MGARVCVSSPVMATLETRGNSIRVLWRLGGRRTGASQSCTFSGSNPRDVLRLAKAAKAVVESRGHGMTRAEVYDAVLGPADEPAGGMPSFAEWVDMWIADRKRMRDIQADVIKSYSTILKSRAVPFLAHYRLSDITPDVLKEWVAWLSSSRITIGSRNKRLGDRLLSTTTIRRVHAITHACLGAAVPKWIPANPAARPAGASKHTSGLPKKQKFEAVFLSREEVHTLLDHCNPHIRDMVDVAVNSGMRLGELVALRVRRVVFDRDGYATIQVREALKNDGEIGEPKSEMSSRDVTLDLRTSRLLRRLCEGRKLDAFVFASPEGGRWDVSNFRSRYWNPSVAAAQRCTEHPPPMPVKPQRGPTRALRPDEVSTCGCGSRLQRRPRFHDLRHTHASICIQKGWHAKKIQVRLGHATYQITMDVYGHLLETGDRDDVDLLGTHLARQPVAEVSG